MNSKAKATVGKTFLILTHLVKSILVYALELAMSDQDS